MKKYLLSPTEATQIQSIVQHLARRFSSAESQELLNEAPYFAHNLPVGLRRFIHEFRSKEISGCCIISGFEIDDHKLGPTPAHWNTPKDHLPSLHAEIFFVLAGSLLGEPFSFQFHTQRDRLIHNVLPMKGFESSQLAFGSSDELLWHTEDAFHSCRADYVGLMCLRNDQQIPTTITPLNRLRLPEALLPILFERRFLLYPDNTHNLTNEQKSKAQLVPVLSGQTKHPYICIDPLYMKGADADSQLALDLICDEISRQMYSIALRPGEICVIDNYRAVHGRKPFSARFDGRDRWLKRIYFTRDLRKSHHARANPTDRLIYTPA